MNKDIKVSFDIQPIANRLGISKEKAAELLVDEIMKLIFPKTLYPKMLYPESSKSPRIFYL